MMRKIFFLVILFFVTAIVQVRSQYLPNQNFELYSVCPTNQGEIFKCTGWNADISTPDYFTCTFNVFNFAPNSYAGGIPSNGNGCIALAAVMNAGNQPGLNVGESTYATLIKNFVSGRNYRICLDLKQDIYSDTSSNLNFNTNPTSCFDFGGYFYNSALPPTTFAIPNLFYSVTPHFSLGLSTITTTYNRHCFKYTANGTEDQFVLSYFLNANSSSTPCNDSIQYFMYLNIDSLSLEQCIWASKNDTICKGDSVLLYAISDHNIYSWEISGQAGVISTLDSFFVSPSITTSYVVYDDFSADTITITVLDKFSNAGTGGDVCAGDSIMLGGSPSGPTGAAYTWSPLQGISCSSCANPMVLPNSTTTYSLTTNNEGCFEVSQVTVNVLLHATASFSVTSCDSIFINNRWIYQSTLLVDTLTSLAVNGCDSIVSYNINLKRSSLSSFSITACDSAYVNNQWVYVSSQLADTLQYASVNGCDSIINYNILINYTPILGIISSDSSIEIGETVVLNASGASNYVWSNGLSNSSISVTPTISQTYCVFTNNFNGCGYDTACVYIDVKEKKDCSIESIFIPNAFSPNGDKTNDELCVLGHDCIDTMLLVIFDRWGNQVFRTTNKTICWDGYYMSDICNTFAFSYLFEAYLLDGKYIRKKGVISLVK